MQAFAHRIGQIPIVLKKENYQYVFNALLGSLNTAAIKLAVDGVASVEDIDRAWMGVMKMPIGRHPSDVCRSQACWRSRVKVCRA